MYYEYSIRPLQSNAAFKPRFCYDLAVSFRVVYVVYVAVRMSSIVFSEPPPSFTRVFGYFF